MNEWPLLLETIKLKDGFLFNLPYHQERMEASSKQLWGRSTKLILKDIIKIPESKKKGLFKVRITYGPTGIKQEIEAYTPNLISSLKLVYSDNIDYSVKYSDRSALNELRALKGACDEILIVKDGLITDTSYSNVVFFDGTCWWTPDFPLLAGTQRAKLLSEGRIKERNIRVEDLISFKEVKLINAMMDLSHDSSILIKNIK